MADRFIIVISTVELSDSMARRLDDALTAFAYEQRALLDKVSFSKRVQGVL